MISDLFLNIAKSGDIELRFSAQRIDDPIIGMRNGLLRLVVRDIGLAMRDPNGARRRAARACAAGSRRDQPMR
jgi:hypothetical protein